MDDHQFRRLLAYFDLSWEGYRRVRRGVKKRLRRHMRQLKCRTLSDYLEMLQRDNGVRKTCERLLMVSISRFFRDRDLWHIMEIKWIPELMDAFPKRLRVWSAGCACGEEAYTFRIVWEGIRRRQAAMPHLSILATDANPECLARARAGIFPKSSLREVPDDIRKTFFSPRRKGRHYEIRPDMRKEVYFCNYSLLSPPPQKGFQFVFLRNNLLTYYRDPIKISAVQEILDCLDVQGLLITGRHETMPYQGPKLRPVMPMVYQRRSL